MSRGHGGGRGPGGAFGHLKDKTRTRPTKELLKLLLKYLRNLLRPLALVTVIILVYTFAMTFSPILIQKAIDLLVESPSLDLLYNIVLLFLFISIIIWIFNSFSTWIIANINASLMHEMREDVFNHLTDADMTYHHTQQSGNVTSRVVSDTAEVSAGLMTFTSTGSQFLLVITTFIVLFITEPLFALISIFAIPTAFIITMVIATIGKRRMLKVRQAYGNTSAKLAEALSGVSISKSFNREDKTSEEIRKLNDETYNFMRKLGQIFVLVMPSIQMVSTILVALVLIVGGSLYSPTGVMTVGKIYLGTIMVQRFLMPLISISNSFTQLQASLAALDRLADVIDAKQTVKNKSDAIELEFSNETDSTVNFENVTFAYKTETQVLKNVSFKIEKGQKVAIVGHTGAGKTTLTALLMRFYDPLNGSIKIGNLDIKDITLESLRRYVSIVTQEPYLFADTVMENIRYGKVEATDDEIFDICTMIGADEFIEALPDGYSTVLQESGKSLSAGQRQMITIARTLLSDPKILVLDEATSRLDAYSESLVQIAQNKLFEGRTTLVIAHRLSTIRDVSKIIVMENGIVSEQGNHEELMINKGHYYELYKTYYAHQGIRSIEQLTKDAKYVKDEYSSENVTSPNLHPSMGQNGQKFSPEMMKERMKNMNPKQRAEMMKKMKEMSR